MAKQSIECCDFCGEPTGRAGAADDSIFISHEDFEIGPLCEACWEAICAYCAEESGLNSELAQLRAETKRLRDIMCDIYSALWWDPPTAHSPSEQIAIDRVYRGRELITAIVTLKKGQDDD